MPMRFSISCMSLWDSYVSFSQLLGNLHFFAQDTADKFRLFSQQRGCVLDGHTMRAF